MGELHLSFTPTQNQTLPEIHLHFQQQEIVLKYNAQPQRKSPDTSTPANYHPFSLYKSHLSLLLFFPFSLSFFLIPSLAL